MALAVALFGAGERPAAAAGAVRVAILPIVVHSNAADPAYVSRGIADMISSRLEQDGRAMALRVDDAGRATTQVGVALEAGRERRADYVLFGAFTQFGDGASLDLHCIPVAGTEAQATAARRIFIQSGAVGEIIPKLDEIVARVSAYVHGTAPPQPVAGAAAPATAANDAALRELVERVKALEAKVYGADGAGPKAAASPPAGPVAETAPGS